MANLGVAPPNPSTSVGIFRATFPDMDYTPVSGSPGVGDYKQFSDIEIQAFLTQAGNSVNGAIGYALLQQANIFAREAISISDYDLRADLTKRAAELRANARLYFQFAKDEENGSEDGFEIVELGDHGEWIPELDIPIYGRAYGWDRYR